MITGGSGKGSGDLARGVSTGSGTGIWISSITTSAGGRGGTTCTGSSTSGGGAIRTGSGMA